MTDDTAATLRVVATIPTNGDPAAATALAGLARASRDEDGCLGYDVFESAGAPGVFVTIEEWRSQADMDAHMGTPHVAEAFEVAGPLLTGELAIHPLKKV